MNYTKVTGVYSQGNKFIALININQKKIILGEYNSFVEAVKSRHKAEIDNMFPSSTNSSAFHYLNKKGLLYD